jgi:NADPH-dependent 2,4-dienoyl-CoA reductase/sulfur reductase-like enzyme
MSALSPPEHVVVVGAGLGGLRTAEELRARGYAGRITLIGAEPHPPYDRPPLSKQVLTGAWEPERVHLRTADALAELNLDLRLGRRAVGLRDAGPRGRTVLLDDGSSVTGDAVVVATGAAARRLPGQPAGVLTLRGLDDAVALRRALGSAGSLGSLLVVGAGFVGAEAAWAAHGLGVKVTVLEAGEVPCERGLGREVGSLAARLFTEAGIDLRCGARITRFVDARTVELADGTTLAADAVLVGVGSQADLGWLSDAGLAIADGLRCDGAGRVSAATADAGAGAGSGSDGPAADGVWAVGDVAAWWDPVRGRHHRQEHWTATVEQAVAVACGILAQPAPPSAVPYVWSDQFGMKIQMFGRTDLADDVAQLHGEGCDGGPVKGTVIGYFAGDQLVAVVAFGAPAKAVHYRKLMAQGATRDAVLLPPNATSAAGATSAADSLQTSGARKDHA